MHIKPMKLKTCSMMTYKRAKPATAGPVAHTYLELKMLCLFSFVLESEKKKPFQMSTFIPQFINVIVPSNDLLMGELNVIYFAPKWWLYVMIWLPRTTDNSTYFAQSLEIRGIESRLYFFGVNDSCWAQAYI